MLGWSRFATFVACLEPQPQAHHGQDLAGDLATLCLGAGISNRRDDYNWLYIIFKNCIALYLSSVFLKPNHVSLLNHHGVLGTGKSAQKSMARRSESHTSTRWCFKVGDERGNVWWITGCWVYSVYSVYSVHSHFIIIFYLNFFFPLECWNRVTLGFSPWDTSPSMPNRGGIATQRSGQRIQDADRQFQGAAALPAPRQTLVNTGEHTQRVYMLSKL